MTDDARSAVRAFIAERFPQAELSDTEDIFEVGFINSLFAVELVMFVEDTFLVTIPDDELTRDNFRSIAAMGDMIRRLSGDRADAR